MDDVLQSLDGLKRQDAPAGLYQKIEQKIASFRKGVHTVPMYTIYMAAACMLVLLVTNFFVITETRKGYYEQQNVTDKDAMEKLVEYYELTENQGI